MPELKDYQRMFIAAEDASFDEREEAEKHRDFYCGYHFTDKELGTYQQRGQLPVVYNRIKRKIDHMTGVELQIRTRPKALARTPDTDDKDTEAVTNSVRYVLDNNRFDKQRSNGFNEYLIEGSMGFEITVQGGKKRSEEPDIIVSHIPWNRHFHDPHSRELDYSDSRYDGVVSWMDLDMAQAKYPNYADDLYTYTHGGVFETYADLPRHRFIDTNRKRVRVMFMYYRVPADNKRGYDYEYVEFSGPLILRKAAPSIFLDDDGNRESGYVFQSAYIDRDGRRFSLEREMVDAQREYNARRSKALHLMSHRQTMAEKGAVLDEQEAKEQLARPTGHVRMNPGKMEKFKLLPTNDMVKAQFDLLSLAAQEIDDIGPNVYATGSDPAIVASSGRAIQMRQQAQLTGLGTLFDGLRQCDVRIYEQVWYRVRQFWTKEKWIRVTDEEQNTKFSMLNQTVRSALIEQGREFWIEPTGQVVPIRTAKDPRLNKKMGADLMKMTVDFIIDEVPDIASLKQEDFLILTELAKFRPQEVPFEDLVELSGISAARKEKYLARKRGDNLRPEDQQQMQALQQAQQLDTAERAANIEKTQADAKDKLASANKKQIETMETLQSINQSATIPVRG